MNEKLLTLNDVSVTRRGKSILKNINHSLFADGTTLIMGPNGSGKTSLLRVIYGLQRANAGQIDWHDQTVVSQKSFVFQTPIVMQRTVLENISYPLQIAGTSKSQAHIKAREFSSELGLQSLLDMNANNLSGGEKQKMALARALITRPRLLVLDEPTSNLDNQSTREIEDILIAENQRGTRILMASHDLGQAKRLANDLMLLNNGTLVEASSANSFFKKPKTPTGRAFLKGDILE